MNARIQTKEANLSVKVKWLSVEEEYKQLQAAVRENKEITEICANGTDSEGDEKRDNTQLIQSCM